MKLTIKVKPHNKEKDTIVIKMQNAFKNTTMSNTAVRRTLATLMAKYVQYEYPTVEIFVNMPNEDEPRLLANAHLHRTYIDYKQQSPIDTISYQYVQKNICDALVTEIASWN